MAKTNTNHFSPNGQPPPGGSAAERQFFETNDPLAIAALGRTIIELKTGPTAPTEGYWHY